MKLIVAITVLQNLMLFVAAIAAGAFSINFTRSQRKRHPWLRFKDGRQVGLAAVFVATLGAAYGLGVAEKVISMKGSLEPMTARGLSATDRATLLAFQLEAQAAANEDVQKAGHAFSLGEAALLKQQFATAENYFRNSAMILPT